jgi:hypothetical protein
MELATLPRSPETSKSAQAASVAVVGRWRQISARTVRKTAIHIAVVSGKAKSKPRKNVGAARRTG